MDILRTSAATIDQRAGKSVKGAEGYERKNNDRKQEMSPGRSVEERISYENTTQHGADEQSLFPYDEYILSVRTGEHPGEHDLISPASWPVP